MKILYIHGLSSSGNSGTAEHLRRLLPNDTIFSPDLPIEPMVALEMLKRLVKEEKINLVIGTSMGGMFAQKLQGTYKILVNPSLHVSASTDSSVKGRMVFLNMKLHRSYVTVTKNLSKHNVWLIQMRREIIRLHYLV